MKLDKQTAIKIILQVLRGQKEFMDPFFKKEMKKYSIFFETELGEYTSERIIGFKYIKKKD